MQVYGSCSHLNLESKMATTTLRAFPFDWQTWEVSQYVGQYSRDRGVLDVWQCQLCQQQ